MIIHALNMSRNYLLGRRIVFMSDHSGLMYLCNRLNQNARNLIWLATLSEFDIEIKYIKGNENWVGDALRRKV